MKFEEYLQFWNNELDDAPEPPKPRKPHRPAVVYIAAILATAVVSLGVRVAPIEAYYFVTVPLSVLAVMALRSRI